MNIIEGNIAEIAVAEFVREFFSARESVVIEHYPVFLDKKELRYEMDVLVLDKELGLINIEIKGLTIDNIISISGYYWKCKDFYSNIIKPFWQAEKQIDSFVEKAEIDGYLKKDVTKRVFVALPFVKENEWFNRKFNLTNNASILFEEDFRFGTWTDKMKSLCLHKAYPNIGSDDYKSLFSLLKPLVKSIEHTKETHYSKVFIISEKKWFESGNMELMDSLKQGQRVFLICNKENYIEYMGTKVFENEGLFSVHHYPDIVKDNEKIIDGRGINSHTDKILENAEGFNYEQFKAVHYTDDRSLMVEASAGTGKTYMLVDRFLYLIRCCSIELKDIILITFTNEATEEIRRRIREKLFSIFTLTSNLDYLRILENIEELSISTVHSFAKKMVVMHADSLGMSRSIRVTSMKHDKSIMVEKLIENFFIDNKEHMIKELFGLRHHEIVKFVLSVHNELEKKAIGYKDIDKIKWFESNDVLDHLLNYVIPRLDQNIYSQKLKDNKIEINDLIRLLSDISVDKKDKFESKILFVDEFQDSDSGQIEFFAKLSNIFGYKLFVIGDIKQSIYRFRGADYTSFEQLSSLLNDEIESLSLVNNYRSRVELLVEHNKLFKKMADFGLIKYDKKDYVKGLKMYESKFDSMNVLRVNNNEIKDSLLEIIRKIINSNEDRKEIAILVRSNSNVRLIKSWLEEASIAVEDDVEGDFFSSKVVMDFRNLINGLMFPTDTKCLFDVYTSPYFNVKYDSVKFLEFDGVESRIGSYLNKVACNKMEFYVQKLKKEPLLTVINRIIEDEQLYNNLYTRMIEENYALGEEDIIRLEIDKYAENLHLLFKLIIRQFDNEDSTLPILAQWLDINVKTNDNTNSIKNNGNRHKNIVKIKTVHKSKGLEFDYVIIPITTNNYSFRKGDVIFNKNTYALSWKYDDLWTSSNYHKMHNDELFELKKEEARLIYVAITRAKKSVSVFLPNKINRYTWAEILNDILERGEN